MEEQFLDIKTEHGEAYEIPAEGSLGLLALGYVGLMLWRKKRAEIQLQKGNENEEKT